MSIRFLHTAHSLLILQFCVLGVPAVASLHYQAILIKPPKGAIQVNIEAVNDHGDMAGSFLLNKADGGTSRAFIKKNGRLLLLPKGPYDSDAASPRPSRPK
jgi:hypothetical protein